jgi:hypothetical protein
VARHVRRGLIGADGDNGIGIAGVDWNAKILPVRVLRRCGGTFDDILAACCGPPACSSRSSRQSQPAKVINLSLGGEGAAPGRAGRHRRCAGAGQRDRGRSGQRFGRRDGFAPPAAAASITVGALGRTAIARAIRTSAIASTSRRRRRFSGDANLMVVDVERWHDDAGQPAYEHAAARARRAARRGNRIAHARAQRAV